ncbi:alkaline phosphatase family protein [bacterium]|nr:alkaline phosphatase family protein [bacterium]
MKPKVIILGLDGATWDLLDPWMEAGELPHIARLVREGASGPLQSTLEPITPCAWASMVTGKNPGKTGVFDFAQVVRGTYDLRFPNRTHVAGPNLWGQAARHGLRCGIVNVPMGYPAEEVPGGVYIAGMGSPGPREEAAFWPEGLRDEVEEALGEPYLMLEFAAGRKSRDGYALFRENLLSYTSFQGRLADHLLSNHELDLFFMVFPAPDQVGHYFWKFHDPRHPLHNEAEAREWGGVMLEVHKAVDTVIGALLERHAGPETHVVLISDHGMGPFHRAPDFVGFLEAEGYLRLKVPVARAERLIALVPLLGWLATAKHRLFTFLKAHLPTPVKGFLNRVLGKGKEAFVRDMGMLSIYDWARTRVFVTDPKNMGEIHINKKGREPLGIVEPEEYEALRRELVDLFEGVALADGTKAVKKAWLREEIYSGPFLEEAPDIVVEWNLAEMGHLDPTDDEIPPRYRSLFRRFDITPSWTNVALPYNGFHRMEGIYVAHGPGIRAGAKLEGARIWDPFLNILVAAGVPVPEGVDSRLLDQWERPPIVEREEAGSGPGQGAGREYSPEEEAAIRARLKEMGYLS